MVSSDIRFTPQAEIDVNQAISYIIDEFGDKGAAKKLCDMLLSTIDRIRAFPESCELVDNKLIKSDNVRRALVSNYLLFYLFDKSKSTVVILRFVYCKRSIIELLKEISNE